jgi:hypothetical protein
MPQQYYLQSRFDGRPAQWRGQLTRAACRSALAVVMVCAAGAVARAGDDTMSSGGSFYDTILQVIGLSGGPNINYSERSPLVVPPTKDLPPPSADVAPAVPDWPKDPDMTRRAKVKEKPKPHVDYFIESARPLPPDELTVPGVHASARHGATGRLSNADYPERDYTPPKKSIFDLFSTSKQQYATFTGEPARTSLTDPPAGLMTPSADQPYGIGPEQKKYKIPSIADRATVNSGSAASGN